MDLSIIIVNYNSSYFLKKCVESIIRLTKGLKFEVIVVDNNSSDGSLLSINELLEFVIVVKNKANVGFSVANNVGLRVARGDVCVLLNPDVCIEDNILPDLHRLVINDQTIGVLGCKIQYPDGNPQTSTYSFTSLEKFLLQLVLNPFRGVATGFFVRLNSLPWLKIDNVFKTTMLNHISNNELVEVNCVTGACMVFRKEILNTVGYLDENFFMYYEDEDFCRRVWSSGLKVKFCPSITITHALGWEKNKLNPRVFWIKYHSVLYYCKLYFSKRKFYYWLICSYIHIYYHVSYVIAFCALRIKK